MATRLDFTTAFAVYPFECRCIGQLEIEGLIYKGSISRVEVARVRREEEGERGGLPFQQQQRQRLPGAADSALLVALKTYEKRNLTPSLRWVTMPAWGLHGVDMPAWGLHARVHGDGRCMGSGLAACMIVIVFAWQNLFARQDRWS